MAAFLAGRRSTELAMKFAGLDIFLLLLVLVPEYPARHLFRSVSRILSRQDLELGSVGYESFQTCWKDWTRASDNQRESCRTYCTGEEEHVCKCNDGSIHRNLQKILRITIVVRERLKAVLALILTFSIPNDGKLSTNSKEDRTMQPSVVNPFRQSGRNQKVRLMPQHTVTAYLLANLRWLSWKASRGCARRHMTISMHTSENSKCWHSFSDHVVEEFRHVSFVHSANEIMRLVRQHVQ